MLVEFYYEELFFVLFESLVAFDYSLINFEACDATEEFELKLREALVADEVLAVLLFCATLAAFFEAFTTPFGLAAVLFCWTVVFLDFSTFICSFLDSFLSFYFSLKDGGA